MWGNPYLKILRSQLERYIAEEFGEDHLSSDRREAELRKVKKEIASLKRELKALEVRKAELEIERGS